MTNDAKRKALTFLLLAMIAAAMIAATMPQLELKPGVPLPKQRDTSERLPAEDPLIVSISERTYLMSILVAAAIVVSLVIVGSYRLWKEVSWKRVSWLALVIAILTPVLLGMLFSLIRIHITSDPLEPEILPPELTRDGPPLGPLPTSLVWLVWIGLVGAVGFFGISAISRAARQTRANDLVELEAEQALRALETGLELKNVIVRCYQQMSLALQKEQGIELEETMTAREFERLLTACGVPYAPVHQLTRLFEGARYGLRPSTPSDEQLAFDCLSAIVQHSRERRQPN
jgi:hypothetical protein